MAYETLQCNPWLSPVVQLVLILVVNMAGGCEVETLLGLLPGLGLLWHSTAEVSAVPTQGSPPARQALAVKDIGKVNMY